MPIPSKQLSLFPTLVQEYDIRDFYDKEEVHKMCDDLKERDDGIYGLFPRSFSCYAFEKDVLKHLNRTLAAEIMGSINQYARDSGFKHQKYGESWVNIGYRDSIVNPHKHSGCNLSATFYPVFPEGSSNLMVSRPIRFDLKPDDQYSGSIREFDTDYNIEHYEIPVKEGHLYVWPAWLHHWTNPNKSDMRIMIGVNTRNK